MFKLHKFFRKKNNFYLTLKYKNLYDLEKDHNYIIHRISKIETNFNNNPTNIIEFLPTNEIIDSIAEKLEKTNKIKLISYKKLIIIFCSLLKINMTKYYVEKNKNKILLKVEKL